MLASQTAETAAGAPRASCAHSTNAMTEAPTLVANASHRCSAACCSRWKQRSADAQENLGMASLVGGTPRHSVSWWRAALLAAGCGGAPLARHGARHGPPASPRSRVHLAAHPLKRAPCTLEAGDGEGFAPTTRAIAPTRARMLASAQAAGAVTSSLRSHHRERRAQRQETRLLGYYYTAPPQQNCCVAPCERVCTP